MRDLGEIEYRSGRVEYFSQTMKEIQEKVNKTIQDNTQKVKVKVYERRKDIQFSIGDYIMVHLNKSRLQKGVPTKIPMKRVKTCKIIEKDGANTCKIDF